MRVRKLELLSDLCIHSSPIGEDGVSVGSESFSSRQAIEPPISDRQPCGLRLVRSTERSTELTLKSHIEECKSCPRAANIASKAMKAPIYRNTRL